MALVKKLDSQTLNQDPLITILRIRALESDFERVSPGQPGFRTTAQPIPSSPLVLLAVLGGADTHRVSTALLRVRRQSKVGETKIPKNELVIFFFFEQTAR